MGILPSYIYFTRPVSSSDSILYTLESHAKSIPSVQLQKATAIANRQIDDLLASGASPQRACDGHCTYRKCYTAHIFGRQWVSRLLDLLHKSPECKYFITNITVNLPLFHGRMVLLSES